MKINPMVRALDHKIADLIKQRSEIEGHLEVLKALRVEMSGLVRKRGKAALKAAPAPADQQQTSNAA
jgi:hypothetical protein